MSQEVKKKAYERATMGQLRFYLNFVQNHPELAAAKSSSMSSKALGDLWKELANGLNSIKGPTRAPEIWKHTLSQWKNQLRCRARKQNSELSEFEASALVLFGISAAESKRRASDMAENSVNIVKVESPDVVMSSREPSSSREFTSVSDLEELPPTPTPPKKRSRSPLFSALMESLKKQEKLEEKRFSREEERAKRQEARETQLASALLVLAQSITSLVEIVKEKYV